MFHKKMFSPKTMFSPKNMVSPKTMLSLINSYFLTTKKNMFLQTKKTHFYLKKKKHVFTKKKRIFTQQKLFLTKLTYLKKKKVSQKNIFSPKHQNSLIIGSMGWPYTRSNLVLVIIYINSFLLIAVQ